MLFYNVKVLGQIHDDIDPLEYYQNTLDILKILINALPSSLRYKLYQIFENFDLTHISNDK